MNETNKAILDNAIKAIESRAFHAQYPEHPKAYGEEAGENGKKAFESQLGNNFESLLQTNPSAWIGEETSPFTGATLNIKYPAFESDTIIIRAARAGAAWKDVSIDDRASVLIDALDAVSKRFFEIAHATMHTSGQSFMMSFQASGPHSNDRALEAMALGYQELTRYPDQVTWEKPMGKFSVVLQKTYKPIPRGIGLVIGCSTFPVWNSVPGMFASMITGNPIIVKPHPGAILPIAIVVAEIQKVLSAAGIDHNVCQLAVDTKEKPITKDLAEHKLVKLIDYTGGSEFGNYIESLPGKTVFTEKAGVNSVIIDSVEDIDAVIQNLSFSVSLYSGQMCTAPQNFFVPEGGIKTKDGQLSYEDFVQKLKDAVHGLATHPKMGAGTLGAIQNEYTLKRVKSSEEMGVEVALNSSAIENAEFENARTCTTAILEVESRDVGIYENEMFGPILMVIKTKNTEESIALAKELAMNHGAITCAAYSTDEDTSNLIMSEMEQAFTPVSLNLTGMIWVNQHAAFSDFHVTGGNPAGNASFTNPEYVNKRFVWVGHRRI